MEYSMEERCRHILAMCLEENSTNLIAIFQKIANREFVRIHGPEHHIEIRDFFYDVACVSDGIYAV